MPAPARSETFRSARGAVSVALLGPRTLWFKASGYYDESLIPHYIRPMTHATSYGPAEVFLDWEEMTGYDSECRKRMTEFALEQSDRFSRVHTLFRNKLVAMGVTTAGLLIGRGVVLSYTRRSEFEQRLQETIDQLTHAKSMQQ